MKVSTESTKGSGSISQPRPQISTSNGNNNHRWNEYPASLVVSIVAAAMVYLS